MTDIIVHAQVICDNLPLAPFYALTDAYPGLKK